MLEVSVGTEVIALAAPFMVISTGTPQEINKTKLIESAIQAVVVGAFVAAMGYFIAFPVLQEKVEQIRREGLETRSLLREIKTEMDTRAGRRDSWDAAQDARLRQVELDIARRR